MKTSLMIGLAGSFLLFASQSQALTDTGDVIDSGNDLLIGNTSFGSRSYTVNETDIKDSARLGNAAGVRGELFFQGNTSSNFTYNIELIIGDLGEGLLRFIGGTIDSSVIIVGNEAGSVGILELLSSIGSYEPQYLGLLQSLGANAQVTVGNAGTGSLRLSVPNVLEVVDGALTANIQNLSIGSLSSGNGSVIVNDGNLTVGSASLGGNLVVGDAGTAFFQDANTAFFQTDNRFGTTVTGPNAQMVVGAQSGSNGEIALPTGFLSIDGNDSRLIIGGSGVGLVNADQLTNIHVSGINSQIIVAQNPGSRGVINLYDNASIFASDAVVRIGLDENDNPGGQGSIGLFSYTLQLNASLIKIGAGSSLNLAEGTVISDVENDGIIQYCNVPLIEGNVTSSGIIDNGICDTSLTIMGNLVQTSSGRYKTEIFPTWGYASSLYVQGSAQISGVITFNVADRYPDQPVPGDLYKILTAEAGLTLDPDLIITTENLDPSLTFETVVDATSLSLHIIPSDTASTADLAVTQTDSPDPVTEGENLTYQINVINLGPGVSAASMLTNTLPADVTFVSATPGQGNCAGSVGVISCNLGTLSLNQSVFVDVIVTPQLAVSGPAPRILSNTVKITGSAFDLDLSNNSSTELTQFLPLTADLAVTQTDSHDPVLEGETLLYQINVTNLGPDVSANTQLTDTLPADVSFVSATPGQGSCTGSGNSVSCDLGSLALNQSVLVDVIVVPQQNASGPVARTLSNAASVSSATLDPDNNNNSSTEQTQFLPLVADLALAKTSSITTAKKGERFSYTITVNNFGPETAMSVVITESLPAELGLVSAPTECTGSTAISCDAGDLVNGGSYMLTLQVEALSGSKNVTSIARVTSPTFDPDISNNQYSVSIRIKGKPGH